MLFVSRIACQQVDGCSVGIFAGPCTVRAQRGEQTEAESGIRGVVCLGGRLAAQQAGERKKK